MSRLFKGVMYCGMLAAAVTLSGCPDDADDNGGGDTSGSSGTGTGAAHGDENGEGGDAGHEHPENLPHDGVLIEFGGDYHGEFVHDEDSVTIYILDAGATEQVAIDAETITVNVTQDGDETQYQLTADADEGDAEGRSSRFTSTETELVEALEAEGAEARVAVVIDETSYQGDLSHTHSHE